MRKNKRRVLRIALILLALLIPLGLWSFDGAVRPRLRYAAEDRALLLADRLITQAASRCAEEGLFAYDALIRVRYADDGSISSLSTDSSMLTLLYDRFFSLLQQLLQDEEQNLVRFPLGSVLGMDSFSALGPPLTLRLATRNTLRGEVSHSLEEAGLNQSLHTVSLHISGTVTVLFSGGDLQVEVKKQLPLAQTLIVGKVPQWGNPE